MTEPTEELLKLIEKTQNAKPARTSLDIYEYIKLHNNKIINEYGKFIKYFEDYFDSLNVIIEILNFSNRSKWSQVQVTHLIINAEILKTLHRAFEDIIDGYYDEALILLRCVYESYIKILFIYYFPNDIFAILYNCKGKRNFNLTNFIRNDLKLDWTFLYRLMSSKTHGKSGNALQKIIEISKGKYKAPICLKFKFDKQIFESAMNISTFLLYVLIHLINISFNDDLKNLEKYNNIILNFQNVDLALKGILERLPEPNKFPSIVKDINDKIDKIISNYINQYQNPLKI